jgi:hypothetical protein
MSTMRQPTITQQAKTAQNVVDSSCPKAIDRSQCLTAQELALLFIGAIGDLVTSLIASFRESEDETLLQEIAVHKNFSGYF